MHAGVSALPVLVQYYCEVVQQILLSEASSDARRRRWSRLEALTGRKASKSSNLETVQLGVVVVGVFQTTSIVTV